MYVVGISCIALIAVAVIVRFLVVGYRRVEIQAACILVDLDTATRQLRAHPELIHCRDSIGCTPLHISCRVPDRIHQDGSMQRLLIAAGADVDTKDSFGYTPLYTAVICGNMAAVEVLLAAGANPNARDNVGATPLRLALALLSEDIVRLLREYGAEE